MYSKLGDIEFSGLLGYSSFEQKEETDYAEHPLVNFKPRLQRIGEKLLAIKLDMFFSIVFCDVEEQIAKLSDSRKAGSIMNFVLGTGEVVGDFVIKSIVKKVAQTDKFGLIIQATLEVELLEYVSATPNVVNAGIAIKENAPLELTYVQPVESEALELLTLQTESIGQMTMAAGLLSQGKSNVAKLKELFKKADKALKKAQAAIAKAKAAIQGVKNIIQSAKRIKKALEDTARQVERARAAIEQGDIDGAIEAAGEMQKGASRLRYANSEAGALAATRRSSFVEG